MGQFNRNAAEGIAVREFHLPNGPCNYLLFVGGKAAGVIEAKRTGVTLSGVAEQAALEAFQSVADELGSGVAKG